MISYLGSLAQFSPAAGRAGRCRQMSLCVGSTRRVLAGQPEVLVPSPRVLRAFSLRVERPGQPEAWRPLPWRGAPFPSSAPARAAGRVSGSLQTGPGGLFAGWEGVASLGLSLPLAPPAASYLQRGWSGSSLEFLSPYVLQTAGGVFPPVNFSSLSHSLKKASSDCSQGLRARPYPKQCRPLLSIPPPLAGGGCGRLGYFSAGSCF